MTSRLTAIAKAMARLLSPEMPRVEASSSAWRRSVAVWKRPSGDFERHLRTIASSAGGRVERFRILVNDSAQGRGGRASRKGAASREHFVKHRPKRKNIRARVGQLALGLLWRHVRRSAHDCAHQRNADALGFVVSQAVVILFRESEIQQLYNPARGREDVRWFEVAMNDPLAVCGLERGRNLPRELQRLIRRKGLRLFTVDDRPPVDVLHDQKIRADVVNLADVGMIERGDGFGLP